jgi:hypothetical protein
MLEIFTIVLNGMPFIKEHLAIFSRLGIPWRWHVVEGVASPTKDTAWCQPVLDSDHHNWLSVDGTSEYLDSIASDKVRVYRRVGPWPGKVEMCNAPLRFIPAGSILHEMDVDEFWSHRQLEAVHALFEQGAGRATYDCDYYLGPDVHVITRTMPANGLDFVWRRTHRITGKPWQAHEPPVIEFQGRDVGWQELNALGLVFKHFSYSTEAQVRFKENYYRCAGALDQWRCLQMNGMWPINPGQYLGWVNPLHGALVDKTEHFKSVIHRMQTL